MFVCAHSCILNPFSFSSSKLTALHLKKGTQKVLILPGPFLKGETDSLGAVEGCTAN